MTKEEAKLLALENNRYNFLTEADRLQRLVREKEILDAQKKEAELRTRKFREEQKREQKRLESRGKCRYCNVLINGPAKYCEGCGAPKHEIVDRPYEFGSTITTHYLNSYCSYYTNSGGPR